MRYASVDLLRTVAIVIMVLVHFSENLSGVILPFAGFGAPLFALLSGVSYALWSAGQQRRGRSELEITKVSLRRGLFVFGVGMAFNVIVWMPVDTFNWDVLTFIGSALMLMSAMRNLPLVLPISLGAIALLVTPVIQKAADYGTYWSGEIYDPDLELPQVITGYFATGYFPLFPWIAFSMAGYAAAAPSSLLRKARAARQRYSWSSAPACSPVRCYYSY